MRSFSLSLILGRALLATCTLLVDRDASPPRTRHIRSEPGPALQPQSAQDAAAVAAANMTPQPAADGFKITASELNSNLAATAAQARVIPVVVGGSTLTFTPNSVMASPGDIVQFQFNARNHTVTQSALETPCQPLQAGQASGINSGFIPFDANSQMVGTFNVPVSSTAPIYMYCATGPHCQMGMVMAINSPSNNLIQYAQTAAVQKDNIPAKSVAGGTMVMIPLSSAVFGVPMAMPQPATPAPVTNSTAPNNGGSAPRPPAAVTATIEVTITPTVTVVPPTPGLLQPKPNAPPGRKPETAPPWATLATAFFPRR